MALKALFSLHTINSTIEPGVAATRDTDAIPPKEMVVLPGNAFYAKDEDDQAFFLRNGAAREATESEARDLEPPKAKKPAKAAAPADDKKADDKKADDTQTGGAGDGANLV